MVDKVAEPDEQIVAVGFNDLAEEIGYNLHGGFVGCVKLFPENSILLQFYTPTFFCRLLQRAHQEIEMKMLKISVLVFAMAVMIVGSGCSSSPQLPPNTPTPVPPVLTETPIPTSTPVFSGTPAPSFQGTTLGPTCNPFWDSARAINLNIANSTEQAEEILFTELSRWTRVVEADGNTIYLTYISPQVVEAIVVYTAIQQGLSQVEKQELLLDIERRLDLNNTMAFLLLLNYQSGFLHLPYEFEPLEQTLSLVNQRRERFAPYLEYTQVLVEPRSIRGDSVQGYVLFPRSVGEGCHPTINVLDDHSFDVRIEQVIEAAGIAGPFQWSYTLLPDIPLERAMNIPTTSQSPELDLSTLNDILSLSLTLLEILALK